MIRVFVALTLAVATCGTIQDVDAAAARSRSRCQPLRSSKCNPCQTQQDCDTCHPEEIGETIEPKPEPVPGSYTPDDGKVVPQQDGEKQEDDKQVDEDPFQPITSNFQTPQVASVQSTAAPNMIGDFLAPGFYANFLTNQFTGPASGGTRLQIGQNNSPIPRDRFAVTYNHFRNAYQLEDAVDNNVDANLDLFTFQYERTFNEGWNSIEFRMPVYSAPDNTQTLELGQEDIDGYSIELGNLSMIYKAMLYQDCAQRWTMTAGMGMTLPTGPDLIYRDQPPATNQVVVKNQTIGLTPFFATVFKPNDRVFHQFFMQADFALNADDFSASTGGVVTQTGDLNHQNILKLDWQSGVWMYLARNGNSCVDLPKRGLQGLAAICELHYATTMNDADLITVGAAGYGNLYNRVDVLNVTMGTTALIGESGSLTTAVVLPLLEVADGVHLADSEFILQYNHYLYPAKRCY
ncbi:MAG: hypothetical protein KDA78_12560 [Planctomycetaceae bacterium]|nr:hypothetical protein [Planctomycetaceae bacterium]